MIILRLISNISLYVSMYTSWYHISQFLFSRTMYFFPLCSLLTYLQLIVGRRSWVTFLWASQILPSMQIERNYPSIIRIIFIMIITKSKQRGVVSCLFNRNIISYLHFAFRNRQKINKMTSKIHCWKAKVETCIFSSKDKLSVLKLFGLWFSFYYMQIHHI